MSWTPPPANTRDGLYIDFMLRYHNPKTPPAEKALIKEQLGVLFQQVRPAKVPAG